MLLQVYAVLREDWASSSSSSTGGHTVCSNSGHSDTAVSATSVAAAGLDLAGRLVYTSKSNKVQVRLVTQNKSRQPQSADSAASQFLLRVERKPTHSCFNLSYTTLCGIKTHQDFFVITSTILDRFL